VGGVASVAAGLQPAVSATAASAGWRPAATDPAALDRRLKTCGYRPDSLSRTGY